MIAQEDRRVRIAIVLHDNYAVRNCARKLPHGVRANDRAGRSPCAPYDLSFDFYS